MRAIAIKVNIQFLFLILCFVTLTGGRNQMSEQVVDKTSRIKWKFCKYLKIGLPVNWIMYTPNTVPDADFLDYS